MAWNKLETTTLQSAVTGATATGTTATLATGRVYDRFTVYVDGISTGTVTVQTSMDGTNWHTVGSALTSDGYLQFNGPMKYINAPISGSSGSTITVTLLASRMP